MTDRKQRHVVFTMARQETESAQLSRIRMKQTRHTANYCEKSKQPTVSSSLSIYKSPQQLAALSDNDWTG